MSGDGQSEQKTKRRLLLVVADVLEAGVLVVSVSGGLVSGGCGKLAGSWVLGHVQAGWW